jgi:hypothetical protein
MSVCVYVYVYVSILFLKMKMKMKMIDYYSFRQFEIIILLQNIVETDCRADECEQNTTCSNSIDLDLVEQRPWKDAVGNDGWINECQWSTCQSTNKCDKQSEIWNADGENQCRHHNRNPKDRLLYDSAIPSKKNHNT